MISYGSGQSCYPQIDTGFLKGMDVVGKRAHSDASLQISTASCQTTMSRVQKCKIIEVFKSLLSYGAFFSLQVFVGGKVGGLEVMVETEAQLGSFSRLYGLFPSFKKIPLSVL